MILLDPSMVKARAEPVWLGGGVEEEEEGVFAAVFFARKGEVMARFAAAAVS